MLNNKGQSLVLFILIIPIFLLLFVLVIDVGNMISIRRELDNINHITIDYGLKKIDTVNEEELKEIIKLNDEKVIINSVVIEENKITINLSKQYDGYFLGLLKIKLLNIKSSYIGEIKDYNKVIERIK